MTSAAVVLIPSLISDLFACLATSIPHFKETGKLALLNVTGTFEDECGNINMQQTRAAIVWKHNCVIVHDFENVGYNL